MISMEVDGVPFTTFKKINVSRSMDEATGKFDFTATAAEAKAFPIRRGASVRIVSNKEAIMTGWVESISPSYSTTDHELQIQGRGKGSDLVDSTLSAGSIEVQPPATLVDVAQQVIAFLGVDMKVLTDLPPDAFQPYTAEEIVSVEAGQGAFEFLEKYARKRQVLISENGDGDMLLLRASGVEMNYSLINTLNNGNNTVLDASSTYNDADRFGQYSVVSQSNLSGLNNFEDQDMDDTVNSEGITVFDNEIRKSRVLYLVAEQSSNSEQSQLRAQWEANIRKARSRVYSATVEGIGLPDTGEPFKVDRLLFVNDYFADINDFMLVKSISMSVEVGGSTTKFDMMEKDAFTLQLNEKKIDKKKKKDGGFQLL